MEQIKKVRFTGKWVEVWFDSQPGWTECCKSYMLWNCVEKENLENRVSNRGFIGLWVVWPCHGDPESIHESWARYGTEGTD